MKLCGAELQFFTSNVKLVCSVPFFLFSPSKYASKIGQNRKLEIICGLFTLPKWYMQLCGPFKAKLKSWKADRFAFLWIYICVDEATRLPLLLDKFRLLSIFVNTEINYLVIICYATLNV